VITAALVAVASFGGPAIARADATSATPPPGEGTNPAEIVAARELFRQATEDADAGRYDEGLDKFKRVAAVKETAAVRFNIARCEEALGKTGTALADFETAAHEGAQDAKAADVIKLASQRADALRPRVPRLTVVPPSPAPDGMLVTLDGGRLASATLGVALPVDPGAHVVESTAPGRTAFHQDVTVGAGEAKGVVLQLPMSAATPIPEKPIPEHVEHKSSSQATWGFVLGGGGVALGIASAVFLVLRNNAANDLVHDCPGGQCTFGPNTPEAQNAQNTKSNGQLYGGLSIGFLAAGGVALVGGVVLIATAPHGGPTTGATQPAVTLTTGAPGTPAGLSLRALF
jgi:hypothetical protein